MYHLETGNFRGHSGWNRGDDDDDDDDTAEDEDDDEDGDSSDPLYSETWVNHVGVYGQKSEPSDVMILRVYLVLWTDWRSCVGIGLKLNGSLYFGTDLFGDP